MIERSPTVDAATQIELRALAARYARAADQLDAANFAGCFLADGELARRRVAGGDLLVARGVSALADTTSRLASWVRTFHQLGQATYRYLDEATIVGEVYCTAHHVTATGSEPPSDLVMHIRYEDRYGHDGQAWRIAHRTINFDFQATLAEVHDIVPRDAPTSSSD